MKNNDILHFRKRLTDWYLKHQRDLPWRQSNHPYHIWASEVMLQQTQVNTVLDYYGNFLKKYPHLKDFADANLQDILKVWEGMGYYARARNFHHAANIVLKDYSGKIPARWQDFRKLPGVGDYIAAAVLSIAFGQPFPVVDGNVKRVLARLHKNDAPVNKWASNQIYKETAGKLLDPHRPGIFNQAIMELGALTCRPKNPICDTCPLKSLCRAYKTRKVDVYPKKEKTRERPQYRIAVGVVFKKDRVLITQRKTAGLLGGLWEFPGGKIKDGELAEVACAREIKEEINLKINIETHLTRIKHAYTHFKIIMDVFCCTYISGQIKLNGPTAYRWIRLDEIDKYPFPKANHKFFPLLKQRPMTPSMSGLIAGF